MTGAKFVGPLSTSFGVIWLYRWSTYKRTITIYSEPQEQKIVERDSSVMLHEQKVAQERESTDW
jgi:hypothetical protein